MTSYIPSPSIAVVTSSTGALRVAAFTCRGLERLSRTVGFPVAVVAAVTDPDRHLQHLRDLWYASGVPMDYDQWCMPFDFDNWDFREWRQVLMDSRWFGRTAHPLATCVDDGSLLIRLPKGVPKERFAASFRDGLGTMRFEVVARHPSRCVRRHHSGRPVAVTSRYARASATDPTPVEVRDLVRFEPRALPRIADVTSLTLMRLVARSLVV